MVITLYNLKQSNRSILLAVAPLEYAKILQFIWIYDSMSVDYHFERQIYILKGIIAYENA